MNKTCVRCSKEFVCDGEPSCWCFELPGLKENEIKYDECVCKDCLQIQYKKRLIGD